jgi:hypothetical protein
VCQWSDKAAHNSLAVGTDEIACVRGEDVTNRPAADDLEHAVRGKDPIVPVFAEESVVAASTRDRVVAAETTQNVVT